MIGIVAGVTMLSAELAVVPTAMQQANANIVMDEEDGSDTSFTLKRSE